MVSSLVKQFPYKVDIQTSDCDRVQLFQQQLTVVPRVHVSALVESASSPKTTPLYQYLHEPSSVKCALQAVDRPVIEVSHMNSVLNPVGRDMIRNIVRSAHSLHISADTIRQCVVCGCVTLLTLPGSVGGGNSSVI